MMVIRVMVLMAEKNEAREGDGIYTWRGRARPNCILMQGTDVARLKGEDGIIRFIFGRSVKSLSNK